MWPVPTAEACMHAKFYLDPSICLATIHQHYRQDRQRSDSIRRTVLQMVAPKPKPGLVASYDIRPGNGEGLFWFWSFINLLLTYLDSYPLTVPEPTRGRWCSGIDISCTICKSFTPRSTQITMPAPQYSIFYRPNALPDAQPTVSKHWKQTIVSKRG